MSEGFDFKKAFFFISPETWELLVEVQAGIEKHANVIIDKRIPLRTAYVMTGTEMGSHLRFLPLTDFNIKSLVLLVETLPPVRPK